MKILAPSILAGNHANLIESLRVAEEDGRKWIHLDIMDGHFVPNLSFGPQTVADLRQESKLFFDVHLMMDQPDRYIDSFIQAGSDLISIHLEPNFDHQAVFERISRAGVKAGLAINPDTPIDGLIPYFDSVDLILLMTVHPGFGGQNFIQSVLEKARKIDQIRKNSSHSFYLQVDGGVGLENVADCLQAGIDVFVAGTAYYNCKGPERLAFAEAVGEEI
ncbi:MAG: ribulose-phosphate 3-epimerase [Opitutae bacterium]|nr:ribulose-phosphate 3-epimerase [Opitutae bacterium]|tara:strand:- start:32 stop:688 length:657 start_codon:yes stop_codon:yes gene_type:complete